MPGRDKKWFKLLGKPVIFYGETKDGKYLYLNATQYFRKGPNGDEKEDEYDTHINDKSISMCIVVTSKKIEMKDNIFEEEININDVFKFYTPEPPFKEPEGAGIIIGNE